jgi:hypothetical protein
MIWRASCVDIITVMNTLIRALAAFLLAVSAVLVLFSCSRDDDLVSPPATATVNWERVLVTPISIDPEAAYA